MLSIIMKIKPFCFLFIYLLVALAVNPANAQTTHNDKYLELAKENYIDNEYEKGDFNIARYLGQPEAKANKILEIIKYKNPKPTSFLSGFYSDEFFKFFFTSSAYQWGSNKTKNGYIITKANDYKNYFIIVLGKPFIETWSILGNDRTGQFGHTVGMSESKIIIGKLSKEGRMKNSCVNFKIKGPIQYFYNPKFVDTNQDGTKELLLRYNVTLGDSYLQILEVYKTQNNQENYCFLTKPKIFKARNGYTYYKDGYFYVSIQHPTKEEGHLNASRQLLQVFTNQGELIKEENLPNHLWTTNIESLDIKYNYD